MRMQIRPWRLSPSTGFALLAGAVFTACCPDPPPAPQPMAGCPSGTAPSTRAELEACIKGLQFDSSVEASDQQPLTVIESMPPSQGSLPCPGDTSGSLSCRYGPMARIEPLIGAQRYSEAELRQGRIIAKISVPKTEREGYKKYGLLPGQDTYWWAQTDKTDTTGVSMFLTLGQDGRLQQVRRRLHRERYDEAYYKRSADSEDGGKDSEQEGRSWWKAIARWIWDLDDEKANTKCGSGSCS